MNNKYTQDERVYFSLGENKPSGWASVAGVQGFVVIIKPEVQVGEWTHIYIIDSQIIEPPVILN